MATVNYGWMLWNMQRYLDLGSVDETGRWATQYAEYKFDLTESWF